MGMQVERIEFTMLYAGVLARSQQVLVGSPTPLFFTDWRMDHTTRCDWTKTKYPTQVLVLTTNNSTN